MNYISNIEYRNKINLIYEKEDDEYNIFEGPNRIFGSNLLKIIKII